jgi:hypothetical protein
LHARKRPASDALLADPMPEHFRPSTI